MPWVSIITPYMMHKLISSDLNRLFIHTPWYGVCSSSSSISSISSGSSSCCCCDGAKYWSPQGNTCPGRSWFEHCQFAKSVANMQVHQGFFFFKKRYVTKCINQKCYCIPSSANMWRLYLVQSTWSACFPFDGMKNFTVFSRLKINSILGIRR